MREDWQWDDATSTSLEFARDFAKQLLTLGTALLTLSVAFYKDVLIAPVDGATAVVLFVTWLMLFSSITFGVLALGTLTGVAARFDAQGHPKKDWPPNINAEGNRVWATLQMVAFGGAMLGMTIVGVASLLDS